MSGKHINEDAYHKTFQYNPDDAQRIDVMTYTDKAREIAKPIIDNITSIIEFANKAIETANTVIESQRRTIEELQKRIDTLTNVKNALSGFLQDESDKNEQLQARVKELELALSGKTQYYCQCCGGIKVTK